MKVLLLAPYPENANSISTTQYPPLGLLYIGGAVKDIVDELVILDANILKLDCNDTYKRVIDFHPDVIGISVNVVTAKVARILAKKFKSNFPGIKLIAGGPLPTVSTEEWVKHFDFVIAGEGEEAFRYLILKLQNGEEINNNCLGICTKDKSFSRALHPNLDELPFPAYDYLVPPLKYYSNKARTVKRFMAPILTSRGCPYSCIFCDKSVHGTNFRARSVKSVVDEVKWLHERYQIRQLDILDDNFTFDIKRANDILEGIMAIDHFAINCQNGIRADRITEELVLMMKQAGVFRVGIGIESGNKKILNKLSKKLDLDKATNAIKLFRKQHITVHGYFIIGFPFESKADILDTMKYAKKANPHFANFSHFFPIIGTPIYKELKKYGNLAISNGEIEDGFYRLNSYLKHCNLTENEIRKIYSKVWRKFYFNPYKVVDIIFSINSMGELLWIYRIGKSMLKDKLLKGL